MSEAEEQKILFEWAEWVGIRLMFHIPNGGSRNIIEAKHLKQQGVKKGIPDIFLPVARNGKHGLFIEMKRTGGTVRKEQKEWITALQAEGYEARVCFGFQEAKQVIERYLK